MHPALRRARVAIHNHARKIWWHSWFFAVYYLFFGLMGVGALVFTPQSIDGAAGPYVTAGWAVASLLVATMGIYGALRPRFRLEVWGNWSGIVATFAYASTVLIILVGQEQAGRTAQFFNISAHAVIFALRLVFLDIEKKKTELVAEQQIER